MHECPLNRIHLMHTTIISDCGHAIARSGARAFQALRINVEPVHTCCLRAASRLAMVCPASRSSCKAASTDCFSCTAMANASSDFARSYSLCRYCHTVSGGQHKCCALAGRWHTHNFNLCVVRSSQRLAVSAAFLSLESAYERGESTVAYMHALA